MVNIINLAEKASAIGVAITVIWITYNVSYLEIEQVEISEAYETSVFKGY